MDSREALNLCQARRRSHESVSSDIAYSAIPQVSHLARDLNVASEIRVVDHVRNDHSRQIHEQCKTLETCRFPTDSYQSLCEVLELAEDRSRQKMEYCRSCNG